MRLGRSSFQGKLVERPSDQSGKERSGVVAARGLTEERVGCRRTIAAQGAQVLACRQQPFGNGEREPGYDAGAAL